MKEKLYKYQGANAQESFKKLKLGFKYTVFLIISVIFSNKVRESYNKRIVYSKIEEHLSFE